MTFTDDPTYAPPSPGVNGGGPPHNIEAEQSVLGAILLSERSLYALIIEEGLQPDDFYRERHRVTYSAMLRLYIANEPIDPLTVAEALRQSGELEAAGVFLEQFRLVTGDEAGGLDDDEIHAVGRAVELQPEERQVLGHVEELGAGIVAKADQALREGERVRDGRLDFGGIDIREHFHGLMQGGWRVGYLR